MLVLRQDLNRPLTAKEVDDNFKYLQTIEWILGGYSEGEFVYNYDITSDSTTLYVCLVNHDSTAYSGGFSVTGTIGGVTTTIWKAITGNNNNNSDVRQPLTGTWKFVNSGITNSGEFNTDTMVLSINNIDRYGVDFNHIFTFLQAGVLLLQISDITNQENVIVYSFTGSTVGSSSLKITSFNNIINNGTLTPDKEYHLSFIPIGGNATGTSGTSGHDGSSGSSGSKGTSGSSGNGTSGSSGAPGAPGATGSSGTSGSKGTSGSSGTSGTSGSSGSNGSVGATGSSGTSGSKGTSGSSGNGTSGTSGSSGNGTSGSSGTSGSAGSSGLDGNDGANSGKWQYYTGTTYSGGTFTTDTSVITDVTTMNIMYSAESGVDYTTWWTAFNSFSTAGNGLILQITEEDSNNIIGIYRVYSSSVILSGLSDPFTVGTPIGIAISLANWSGFGTLNTTKNYTISWVYNGINGTSGSSGNGTSGSSGSAGSSGTSGSSGSTGSRGSSGSSGTSGSSGNNGSSGSSGAPGAPGLTGISAGQVYYFNPSNIINDGYAHTYNELSNISDVRGSDQITGATISGLTTNTLVGYFVTPSGQPNVTLLPGGVWNLHLYLYSNTSGNNLNLYAKIYQNSGGVEALLATSALTPYITNSTATEYIINCFVPTNGLVLSDRIVVRLFANNVDSSNHIITLASQTTAHYSYITTSIGFASGTSGTSGHNGSSGSTGTSGNSGSSGTSGNGTSGTTGSNGLNGDPGVAGSSGTSGSKGTSGTSGTGSSGTSGNGSSGTSGTSASGTLYAQTLFVDRYNGSDSTGVIGNIGLPYKTIVGAANAAISAFSTFGINYTIHIFEGSYNESSGITVPTNMTLNFYLETGVNIAWSTVSDIAITVNPNGICNIAGTGRKQNTINFSTEAIDNYGSVSISNVTLVGLSDISGTPNYIIKNESGSFVRCDNAILRFNNFTTSPQYCIWSIGSTVEVETCSFSIMSTIKFCRNSVGTLIGSAGVTSWMIYDETSDQSQIRIHKSTFSIPQSGGFIFRNPTESSSSGILLDGNYFHYPGKLTKPFTIWNDNSIITDNYYIGIPCNSGGAPPDGAASTPWASTTSSLLYFNDTIQPY